MYDGLDRQSASKEQRDRDQLNLEMSGQGDMLISRFLSEGDERSPDAQRKKQKKEQERRRLVDLLTNPIYKAKYEQAWDVLIAAENAVAKAYIQLDGAIDQAKQLIADMEDRAARLPNGKLVFRDEDGTVRYADGSEVDSDDAAGVEWTGNEPSFDEYSGATIKLDALEQQRREVERYEIDVLGDARGKLSDQDNGQTLDGLDGVIDGIQNNMPDIVRENSASEMAIPTDNPVQNATIPVLGIGSKP